MGLPAWLLQALALAGLNEIAKMASTCTFIPRESLSRFLLSSSCFKINKGVSFTYGLEAFQTASFAPGCGVSEFVCEPFKKFSVLSSSVVLLDALCWFSKPYILGAHLSGPGHSGWGAGVGDKTLGPQGKVLYF